MSSIVDDSGAMRGRPGGGTDVAIGCVTVGSVFVCGYGRWEF